MTNEEMDLSRLDSIDLAIYGDGNERVMWELLRDRFPSYEVLWRWLIVPLTNRVDPHFTGRREDLIRFRKDIPKESEFEWMAMCHYSVFYFLARAVKRLRDDPESLAHPEDVFFLLHSVGDNFEEFRKALYKFSSYCGRTISDAVAPQYPKGFPVFHEISDYRNVLLHNPVIVRGKVEGKTLIPGWHVLESSRKSWRVALELSETDLISTKDLFDRLLGELFNELEIYWKRII